MTTCSSCDNEAIATYDIPGVLPTYYCADHLPSYVPTVSLEVPPDPDAEVDEGFEVVPLPPPEPPVVEEEGATIDTPEAGGEGVTLYTEIPEGTVPEVLEWVGDDAVRAKAALDAELEGKNRVTLTSELERIVE